MNNNFHPHRSRDTFRIVLVLAGLVLSITIIIAQIPSISLNTNLIFITLLLAGGGAILSTVSARRISVRIGKEPLAKIFISFSYSAAKFVDKLTYELTQRGFEVLRADHALLAGDNVNEKITELLYEADFLIVVISNKSAQSKSVLNETVFFKEREKKIFPLLIEKIEQSSHLLDILSEIQFVNFTKNFNDGLKKLMYSLEENANKVRNEQSYESDLKQPPSTPNPGELDLYQDLLSMVRWDRTVADRLIEFERRRAPTTDRNELIRRAIERLLSDRE